MTRALNIFSDEKENKGDLRKARQELKDLERKIRRKKVPPVEFEFNKAKLKPYSKRTLELLADLLFKYPTLKLSITGHTCDIGNDKYNLWLSQKRAHAVKGYLIKIGVMGEFIRAKGYGEKRPLASNETEEGREKNRRVEFRLTTRIWNSVY